LVDEYQVTPLCESITSFEREIDRLQSELDEMRREAQLRWAEHEARIYKIMHDPDGSGRPA
jgi:hypothetical protein